LSNKLIIGGQSNVCCNKSVDIYHNYN
jgi:hypothetical protein